MKDIISLSLRFFLVKTIYIVQFESEFTKRSKIHYQLPHYLNLPPDGRMLTGVVSTFSPLLTQPACICLIYHKTFSFRERYRRQSLLAVAVELVLCISSVSISHLFQIFITPLSLAYEYGSDGKCILIFIVYSSFFSFVHDFDHTVSF